MTRAHALRAAPLVALALAAGGCATDASPLVITGFTNVTAAKGGCTAGTTPLSAGLLDSAKGQAYLTGLVVENQLAGNADEETGRTDTNAAFLDTAVTSYSVTDDSEFTAPAPARLPVLVVVKSGGTSTVLVPLLAAANGADLANRKGTLKVTVQLTGKLADGSAVETTKVVFPVEVCADCLSVCAAGEEPSGVCAGGSAGQPDTVLCESASP